MANDLTGDYDVVAAFSLGAVNRILAAMHRGKRLPHALSMAVDLPSRGLGVVAVSVVDKYGSAVTDTGLVKQSAYASAVTTAASSICTEAIRTVDPVVNWRPEFRPELISPGLIVNPNVHVGVAQLQLGPPTMQLPANRTDRADIHTPAMIHYRPDDATLPLAPFMRGDIVTSFGVKPVRSAAGTNIVVDVAGPAGAVHFDPAFSSNSLNPADRSNINKALSLALKQSFKPSSTPKPANLKQMHFKGFPGSEAVAVLMNVTSDEQPNPASVEGVSLRPGDHFALAVNGDSITGPFAAAVNAAITPRRQDLDTTIQIDYFIGTYTFHIYTVITVGNATVQLGDIPFIGSSAGTGEILLTIPVSVRFGWKDKPDIVPNPVNFDFTISQAFTLTLNGRRVGIQRLGGLAVNIPPGVPEVEAKPAREQATKLFDNAWNSQAGNINDQINKALSADGLQEFVTKLMNPKAAPGASKPSAGAAPEQITPDLHYTRFEIVPAGIILHGGLAVPPWPAPHSEFDKDPWASATAPEYRALNSWIPGGTIQEFQWSYSPTSKVTDSNRFVTVNADSLSSASSRICLRFSGSRITAAGPVFYETVHSASICKRTGIAYMALKTELVLAGVDRPQVFIPKPGAGREHLLEAIGHVSPWAPDGLGGGAANFVIHYPDERSARQLDLLPRALEEAGRTDTATAILCVLTREQLAQARTVEGVLYAEDAGAWERLMEVRERPATVVLSPSGETVWRHQGEIDGAGLAQALRKCLAPGGQFFPQFIESQLRTGELSPNFVFESFPGERLTLRDLAGRPVALIFLRDSSAPSLATLRNLHKIFARREAPGGRPPLIVAIDDGGGGEFARGLAAACREGGLVAVADPERQIARAYGVTLWPTTVFLDANGLVQEVNFGLISEQDLEPPVESQPVPTSQPEKEC